MCGNFLMKRCNYIVCSLHIDMSECEECIGVEAPKTQNPVHDISKVRLTRRLPSGV